MTGADRLKQVRQSLGLSPSQMAGMLGYSIKGARQMVWEIENGRKKLMPPQSRLLDAYEAGYRPKDWPVTIAEPGEKR